MKISLNQLLKTSICSYWGPLDLTEGIDSYLEDDLSYIAKDWLVSVDTDWTIEQVNTRDIAIDWEYLDNYEDIEVDYLTWRFDDDKLTKALSKYGITKIWYSIRKPQYYNFEQDSLDLEFEYTGGKWQEQYKDLIPYVQQYIDEVRQPSRDWYISFEPTKVENVDKDDSAYIWAILKKENLLDELKDDLELGIEDTVCNDFDLIQNIQYKWNWRAYRIEDDKLVLI